MSEMNVGMFESLFEGDAPWNVIRITRQNPICMFLSEKSPNKSNDRNWSRKDGRRFQFLLRGMEHVFYCQIMSKCKKRTSDELSELPLFQQTVYRKPLLQIFQHLLSTFLAQVPQPITDSLFEPTEHDLRRSFRKNWLRGCAGSHVISVF